MTHPFVAIVEEAQRMARDNGGTVSTQEVLLAGILCQLCKLGMPMAMLVERCALEPELSKAEKERMN